MASGDAAGETQAGPSFSFYCMAALSEAQRSGVFHDDGNIVFVKTAEQHGPSGFEGRDISGEVAGDYIAVDIGDEDICRGASGEEGGIAEA